MKKFNLTIVVTILMLSFGCQKEIKSTSESTAPNSSTEESGIVMKCNTPNQVWEWYDNTQTTYPGDYIAGPTVPPGPFNYGLIAHPQVNGSPDYSTLIAFFDEIEYGTNQDVIDFITQNANTLVKYFDECLLSLTKAGEYTLEMHLYENISGGGQYEFVKFFAGGVTLEHVYPVLLN